MRIWTPIHDAKFFGAILSRFWTERICPDRGLPAVVNDRGPSIVLTDSWIMKLHENDLETSNKTGR